MSLTDSLAILITANGAQAEREFSKVGAAARRSLGQAETSAQQWGRTLTSAGVAMAAFGGVALVGLYKAAEAADEENQAILRLENSLANSPATVGATTDAFLEQAAAMQDSTTFADDMTISAQAMLATFRLTEDQILQLTPLVADLSAKFGVDMDRAAIAVGKAMQGNVGTLQRWGVQIEEGGNATERFNNLIEGLRENAGGFAAQQGRTFSGQLTILKNNLGDVAEGIGQGVIPAFQTMLRPVFAASDAFGRLDSSTQQAAGGVLAFGSAGLLVAGGVAFVAGQVLQMGETFSRLSRTTIGTRIGLLALNPAFQAVAAAAGIGALAAYGDSLNDITIDAREFAAANDQVLTDVAERYAMFAASFGSEGEVFGALEDLAEQDIVAGERFGEALRQTGFDGARVSEVLREVAEANVAQSSNAAEAAATNEALAGGFTDTATAAEDAEAAISEMNSRIDDYLGRIQGVEEAAAAEAEAQQAFFAALVENGNNFNVNSEAGRENIQMRNSWVEAVAGQVQAAAEHARITGNYEAAQRTANGAIRAGIGDLRGMRDAGLITQQQFQTLKGQIERIPSNIPMQVGPLEGYDTTSNQLQAIYREALRAAAAVGQIGGSLAGGGTYGGERAEGGSVSGGTAYLVGEAGPELFMPRQSGTIVPNGGRGRGIQMGGGLSEQSIERAMARALARTPVMVAGSVN